jgi:hypothetical protein
VKRASAKTHVAPVLVVPLGAARPRPGCGLVMLPSILRATVLSALLLVCAAAAPPPLVLTDCSEPESLLCTGALLPSRTVSCSGAPVYFSTWSAGEGLLALHYTPDGAWKLVFACSTRAACFVDVDSSSCGALLDALDCGTVPACASVTAFHSTASGEDADPLQLVSLDGLTVSAAPGVIDGFACAPTNDAAQCAALGEAYLQMGGDSWTNNIGWRSAAAGVPTDVCDFYGVECEARVFSACAPYEASATDSARANTTVPCTMALPAGKMYTITTCPAVGTNATLKGDTYLRLVDSNGTQIDFNDDGGKCGTRASMISFYAEPDVASQNITIQQGCFGSGYCNATVTISVNSAPEAAQSMCVHACAACLPACWLCVARASSSRTGLNRMCALRAAQLASE